MHRPRPDKTLAGLQVRSNPITRDGSVGSDGTFPSYADLALSTIPYEGSRQPQHGLTACKDNHGIKKATTQLGGDSGLEGGPNRMDSPPIQSQTPVVGENDGANAFKKSSVVLRSPTPKTPTTALRGERSNIPNTMLSAGALGQRTEEPLTKAEEAMNLVQKLDDFVQKKSNIHLEVKTLEV